MTSSDLALVSCSDTLDRGSRSRLARGLGSAPQNAEIQTDTRDQESEADSEDPNGRTSCAGSQHRMRWPPRVVTHLDRITEFEAEGKPRGLIRTLSPDEAEG